MTAALDLNTDQLRAVEHPGGPLLVLAARPFLGGCSTINRLYFNRAMQTEGVEAQGSFEL